MITTLEAKHRVVSVKSSNGPNVDLCTRCGTPWPCDVGVMLSALESSERELEAALVRVKALEAGLAEIEGLAAQDVRVGISASTGVVVAFVPDVLTQIGQRARAALAGGD